MKNYYDFYRFYFIYDSIDGEKDFYVPAKTYQEAWKIAKMFHSLENGCLTLAAVYDLKGRKVN